MVARAAAMQIGLPPKVEAWEPGIQSISSARVMQMPSGMPEQCLWQYKPCPAVPRMLNRPPFARPSGSRLHLVDHQQNAVLVADPAQLLHEDIGRYT